MLFGYVDRDRCSNCLDVSVLGDFRADHWRILYDPGPMPVIEKQNAARLQIGKGALDGLFQCTVRGQIRKDMKQGYDCVHRRPRPDGPDSAVLKFNRGPPVGAGDMATTGRQHRFALINATNLET